ncbi:MAG TPA: glycosyltransferase family 2 protein [Candidatus Krumholzibacteria bacterium]|nr:glycosyltransferase family 2 protein [Candidatus Krumholzibacteria bacterium]
MTAPVRGLCALVIAQDAADSIVRCVDALAFADEVVVVDGGSVDDTAALARAHGARVVVNRWPGFAVQRRFALAQTQREWVLVCDADEEVTPDLARAVRSVVDAPAGSGPAGYRVRRRNQFLGGWIDVGPWSADRQLRLARRDAVRVTDASVHEGYAVDGPVGLLAPVLNHYTHPTVSACVRRMNEYTTLEAPDRAGRRRVGPLDPLVAPAGVFFNYYVGKGCWRTGVRGFVLAATTAMYKSILYMKIRELQGANGGVHA